MSLVLASASPRRHELLLALGLRFEIRPAAVDEQQLASGLAPGESVERLALAKAEAVATPDAVAIGADTIVVLDDRVLGKPRDDDDACSMLAALRDRTHRVLTGVSVVAPAGSETTVVVSDVRMRDYADAEIAAYVATGASRDKAGSYGIQDESFRPVASISGCWCNVMGLPLWTAYRMLREAGLLAPRSPDRPFARCAMCPLVREDA
jgi:MAF protein